MNQIKIYLPPPANHQDFQVLAEAIAKVRYDPPSVMAYGRNGQKQKGIDVYAVDLLLGGIGIQCKESKDDLTEKEIVSDADKAKSFKPKLSVFILMTTARTDATLQEKVIELNKRKAKKYPFKIRVEFWDDLINDINRYSMVLNGYYRSYQEAFQKTDESAHLSCLRIAFDRPAFKDDFLYERSYDDFEEALVSTKRFFRTGLAIDRWTRIPIAQTIPVDFLPQGPYRTFITALERSLEQLYRTYISEKRKIAQDPRHARDRAGQYNILRRNLLSKLNKKLSQSGVPEIQFNYV